MQFQPWEQPRCTAHNFDRESAQSLHCSLPEGHEGPHRDRRAGVQFEACQCRWCEKVRQAKGGDER